MTKASKLIGVVGLILLVSLAEARQTKEEYCRQYANKTIEQVNERMGLEGFVPVNEAVWSTDWKLHYNWCMSGTTLAQCEAAIKNRQDWLDSERRVRASGKKPQMLPEQAPQPMRTPGIVQRPRKRLPRRPRTLHHSIFKTVSSELMKKLKITPRRDTLVNFLMSNQIMRTTFQEAAKRARIPANQLEYRGLNGMTVHGDVVLPTEMPYACNPDWNAGIRFNPFSATPVCHNSQTSEPERLAIYGVRDIGLSPHELGIALQDLPYQNFVPMWSDLEEFPTKTHISLEVMVPPGDALYLITIHMVTIGPKCEEAIQNLSHLPLYNYDGYIHAYQSDGHQIDLKALPDDSGYVGVVTYHGTERLRIEVINLFSNPCWTLFGGITIIRL